MHPSRLIVDGNNLLHAWRQPPTHARDFAGARWALARHLDALAGEIGAEVVLVFDGVAGGRDEGLSPGGVQVLYAAASVTADLLIERTVRAAPHPEAILVVTSDLAVQRAAVAAGAEVMSCTRFFEWAEERADAMHAAMRRPRPPRQGPRLGDFFPD